MSNQIDFDVGINALENEKAPMNGTGDNILLVARAILRGRHP